MTITINGTSGIVNDATDLNYTGTLTGGTGVVNLGSGQLVKDASGNLGLGVTPSAAEGSFGLQVGTTASTSYFYSKRGIANNAYFDGAWKYYATSGASLYQPVGSVHTWYVAPSGTAGAAISFTEAARIDSSGNLLVGTTSTVNAAKVEINFNGSAANGIVLQTTRAATGSVYALFINSAGATAGQISQNGTTTVAYTTSSDYRLKEAVQPMTGALAKVAALKPVTYKWKSDGSDSQGFIAHELQEVVPDCVVGEKDAVNADGKPQYQGIDTSFLVATLTAAIQEQQTLITALTARITALEGTAA